LRLAQPLAAGIGEQPVDHAGDVRQVKARRGSAPWTRPELLLCEAARGALEIFGRLNERVCGRHEVRVDAFERAAKPGLRLTGHDVSFFSSSVLENATVPLRSGASRLYIATWPCRALH